MQTDLNGKGFEAMTTEEIDDAVAETKEKLRYLWKEETGKRYRENYGKSRRKSAASAKPKRVNPSELRKQRKPRPRKKAKR